MSITSLNEAQRQIAELIQQGQILPALRQAELINRQRPGFTPMVSHQVTCLVRLGRNSEAVKLLRRTLRHVSNPDDRATLVSQYIGAHTMLGRYDDAIEIARSEHERLPESPMLASTYVYVLSLAGHKDEAIRVAHETFDRLDAPSLRLGVSYSMAALRTEHAPRALQYLLDAFEHADEGGDASQQGHTQLGHLLDRAKRYDEAFAHYLEAARLSPTIYDPSVPVSYLENIRASYRPERFEGLRRPEPYGPRPVFVVGMPRSGTTLTEQIIDAHPEAVGAGELHLLSGIARDLASELGGPDRVAPDTVPYDRLCRISTEYRDAVRDMIAPKTPAVFVDKAPMNFWKIGLIAMAFPDARVIHCRRDPRDTCLSCFFQSLNTGHAYANDLRNCGHFYRQYRGAMDHYRALAGDPRAGLRLLEIDYEDTVADQEAQTRRILEFIGLPFDEACLKFNETGRVAITLSNDQVRQPIYTSSTKRYERYADHIGPLVEALGDVLDGAG